MSFLLGIRHRLKLVAANVAGDALKINILTERSYRLNKIHESKKHETNVKECIAALEIQAETNVLAARVAVITDKLKLAEKEVVKEIKSRGSDIVLASDAIKTQIMSINRDCDNLRVDVSNLIERSMQLDSFLNPDK